MKCESITCSNNSNPCICFHESGEDINSSDGRVVLLTMDGLLYQWGNISANLTPSISREPQLVLGALENQQVTQIACGDHHTLALTKEGDVYAWGMNYCGQLGLGNKDPQANPVKVPLPDVYYHKVAMLACGRWTSFALDVAGNVSCYLNIIF